MSGNFRKKKIALAGALMFVVTSVSAQTVKGVVTDNTGEPIIGASVMEVGQAGNGGVTDIDGNFSLSAPAGAKLEITYIGMQSKSVKAGKNMKIVLDADDHALDEVMVVAYGTAKKSAFTGSAAVIGSEELSKKVTTNVADALVGSVSGLQMRGS